MAYSLRERKAQTDYSLLNAGLAGSVFGGDAAGFERRLAATEHLYDAGEAARRVRRLASGREFTLDWVREHGLKEPVVIDSREGLGMRLPGPGFTVRDVADTLGHDYAIEVMDVATQTEIPGWSLGAWADYFHKPASREAVLNCITLEFSGTPLEALVRAPRVVRQLDWIDLVWPAHRRLAGQYPAVQFYALMGTGGSWTDAHIDFGGSSVWYAVHTGKKRFFFTPPTEDNLKAYEAWTASPDQARTFFAEWATPAPVTGSFFVDVEAGQTLIIPAGYIHAVYTPVDSLVFGGNFLHLFDAPGQLRIFQLEQSMRVPRKFRFPYYAHLQYFAAGYALQFARLPGWVPAMAALERERQDWLAQQALEDMSGEGEASAGRGAFAPSAAVKERLLALGLSWPEVAGLPALADTLLHLRRLALARAGVLDALPQGSGGSEAQETEAAAAALLGGAASAAPAAAPEAKPVMKLKLKLGGKAAGKGGEGGAAADAAAPPEVAAATAPAGGRRGAAAAAAAAAPAGGKKAKPRVKGGTRLMGDGMIVGDDEEDAFPSTMAAQEAACMANALSAEDMLEELRARIGAGRAVLEAEAAAAAAADEAAAAAGGDAVAAAASPEEAARAAEHTVREGLEERWPPSQPASVLRQHRGLLGLLPPGRVPIVVSALAALGGQNPPKGVVGNPPLQSLVGGFGLYNGAFPAFAGEQDEVSVPGAGYSYNEEVEGSGGAGAGGRGAGDEEEEYTLPSAAAAEDEEDDDDGEDDEGGPAASKAGKAGNKRRRAAAEEEDDDSDFLLEDDEDEEGGDAADAAERRRAALSEEIAELQADAADLLLRDANGKLIRRGGGEAEADEALEEAVAASGRRRRRRRGEEDDEDEEGGGNDAAKRPRKRAKKAEESEGLPRGPRRGVPGKPAAAVARNRVKLEEEEDEEDDGTHASYFDATRGAAAHTAFGGTQTASRRLLPAGGGGGAGAATADDRLMQAFSSQLGGGGMSEIVLPSASNDGAAPPPRPLGLSMFEEEDAGTVPAAPPAPPREGDLLLRPGGLGFGPRASGPRRGLGGGSAASAGISFTDATATTAVRATVAVAPPPAPSTYISLGPAPTNDGGLTGAALLRSRMEAFRKGGRR